MLSTRSTKWSVKDAFIHAYIFLLFPPHPGRDDFCSGSWCFAIAELPLGIFVRVSIQDFKHHELAM